MLHPRCLNCAKLLNASDVMRGYLYHRRFSIKHLFSELTLKILQGICTPQLDFLEWEPKMKVDRIDTF